MFQNSLRTILATGATLLLTGLAAAQTAQIAGRVTDATESVIPGARILVVNQNTGIEREAQTNAAGYFVITQLPAGTYQLQITAEGFRALTRSDINLNVEQVARIDERLEIGSVTEVIEVTQTAPLLESSRATIGTVIDNKRIMDLPLNGRNPLSLAGLTPGVNPAGTGATPQMGGGRNSMSEVTIDGVSAIAPENNVGINRLVYTPQVDSVQEFKVELNALSAEYGRFSGGVINLVTKSGTNEFHGTAYEFLRNSELDANNFFANRSGTPRGSFKRNQFGGTAGGPIVKNRTFFFAGYEGSRQRNQSVFNGTMPTAAWRAGDFAGLAAANGQAITVFDPTTVREDAGNPGRFIRDPFPNNAIPTARINPVSRNVLGFVPLGNTAPSNRFTNSNNFNSSGSGANDANRFDAKGDHNFSDNWRMSGRWSGVDSSSTPFLPFDSVGAPVGGPSNNFDQSISLDNTITLSPTVIANIRYGFGRANNLRINFSDGFDFRQLGFSENFFEQAQFNSLNFPRFNMGGVVSDIGAANWTRLDNISMNHTVGGSVTKVMNRHTLKFGGEWRKLFVNFQQFGFPSGEFNFNRGFTQREINTSSNLEGFPFASFLLGLGSGGQISHEIAGATASTYFAFYIQDDWRATDKLTVNLGLRFDVDRPRTERFDRLSFFDPDAPSGIAGQVPASPSCAECSNLRGAIGFVDGDNRRQAPTDDNNFGPRIGIAYQWTQRTVIRAGYGIAYLPSVLQAAGTTGTSGMQGFRQTTPVNFTFDTMRTIATTLDNPFNQGFRLPPGNTLGALTDIGFGVGDSFFNDSRNGMAQQWNFNIQRQLPGNLMVEFAYLGNRGTFLPDGDGNRSFSQLTPEFMNLGSQLLRRVDNPFFGVITDPSSQLSQPTVNLNQLLRPFPQFTGVGANRKSNGNSEYHAFTTRVEKRFSSGLSFLVAFTGAKLMDDASSTVGFLGPIAGSRLDHNNRRNEWAVSSIDVSRRLVTSWVYDLPFGSGKKFAGGSRGILGFLASGWQANGILTFSSGTPIFIGGVPNNTQIFSGQRANNDGRSADIDGGSTNARVLEWFDTSVFSIPAPFTFGNVGRTLPDVRNPGRQTFDLSFLKNNQITERLNLQYRLEMFNSLNTPQFNGPNNNIQSGSFGQISSAAAARQIQMALKLIW